MYTSSFFCLIFIYIIIINIIINLYLFIINGTITLSLFLFTIFKLSKIKKICHHLLTLIQTLLTFFYGTLKKNYPFKYLIQDYIFSYRSFKFLSETLSIKIFLLLHNVLLYINIHNLSELSRKFNAAEQWPRC